MKKSTKMLLIVIIGVLTIVGPSCIWLARNGNPETPQEPDKNVHKGTTQPGS